MDHEVDTPYGRITWDGHLGVDTVLSVTPPGEIAPVSVEMYRMIKQTNGRIWPYLGPHLDPPPPGVVG